MPINQHGGTTTMTISWPRSNKCTLAARRQYNSQMNYIVVRPYNRGFSAVSIVMGSDTQVIPPFESWALDTGKKIIFANNKMHKMLASHYMLGSYQTQASYAYTFEEMCAIMTSNLGPSDRERYLALRDDQGIQMPVGTGKWEMATYIGLRSLHVAGVIFVGIAKIVAVITILPILIHWMSKKK